MGTTVVRRWSFVPVSRADIATVHEVSRHSTGSCSHVVVTDYGRRLHQEATIAGIDWGRLWRCRSIARCGSDGAAGLVPARMAKRTRMTLQPRLRRSRLRRSALLM